VSRKNSRNYDEFPVLEELSAANHADRLSECKEWPQSTGEALPRPRISNSEHSKTCFNWLFSAVETNLACWMH